jgi:hypothetical protein
MIFLFHFGSYLFLLDYSCRRMTGENFLKPNFNKLRWKLIYVAFIHMFSCALIVPLNLAYFLFHDAFKHLTALWVYWMLLSRQHGFSCEIYSSIRLAAPFDPWFTITLPQSFSHCPSITPLDNYHVVFFFNDLSS